MRKRRDGGKCDFHSLSLSLSPPCLCLENSVDQWSSAFVISTPFCLFPCKLFQAQASLVASLKRENGDVSFLPRTSCAKKLPAGVQKILHCLLIQCPVVMPSAICAKTLPKIQCPVQIVQRHCLLIQCPVVCLLNELPCSCCLLLWTAVLKVHVECVCWFFTEISIFAPWRCCFNSMKAFLLLTSQCTCQVCSVVFDQQNASSCVFVIVIVCDVF